MDNMQKRDHHRIRIFLMLAILLGTTAARAQVNRTPVSVASELKPLYDIAALPEYRAGTRMFQVSSYDTTGGNDDGFSGKYSFLRKDEEGHLVLFDTKGSGVINRIWTPTPTDDTLDFYIDDMARPAFSVKFRDLFSGTLFPFIPPLCGNEVGGFYCYLPIPFQRHCKIVYRGAKMEFYQIQCRLYPDGTPVKNFRLQLDGEGQEALKRIASLWESAQKNIADFSREENNLSVSESIEIKPGETRKLFELAQGGRITGLEIGPSENFAGNHKQLDLRIRWDQEAVPAVDCPLADFFGYAFGQPSMRSLLLGSQDNKNYCYFPMPFDKNATVSLHYRNDGSLENLPPVKVKATIYYTRKKRDPKKEGKFYAHWNSERTYRKGDPHVFLNTKGRGQYVGTILQAQGLRPGMTLFFEGDDSTAIDGVFRMHGTGSEDYFNGGWYALLNRWDGKMSLPLHGALTYSLPLARTGGYRLFLSDKIPFEKSFFHSMEHGPTDDIPGYYTSLAFYYKDTPPAEVLKPENNITNVFLPDTLAMYPQLMQFTVSGRVDLHFAGPLILTGDNGSLARIDLSEIPAGRYKLYMDYNKDHDGGDFAIWQRQVELADGLSAYSPERKHIPEQYLCDIDIQTFKNTLTIKFKTVDGRKSLSLNRLIFMRVGGDQPPQ